MSKLSSALFAAFLLPLCLAAHANVCPVPQPTGQECDQEPPPPGATCEYDGYFDAKASADSPVTTYQFNNPVPAGLECYSAPGGMICEGWAQDVEYPAAYLRYGWRVRVGNVSTSYYCTGTEAYTDFTCSPNQPVQVTLILENGSYSASTTRTYTCGNLTQ